MVAAEVLEVREEGAERARIGARGKDVAFAFAVVVVPAIVVVAVVAVVAFVVVAVVLVAVVFIVVVIIAVLIVLDAATRTAVTHMAATPRAAATCMAATPAFFIVTGVLKTAFIAVIFRGRPAPPFSEGVTKLTFDDAPGGLLVLRI